MYVQHRFVLDHLIQDKLQSMPPKFGYNGFGELIFFRTYSRMMKDGGQESWADCVIRVTNGTFSIRKDFYLKNRIPWDEGWWQEYAKNFAISMFQMKWLPPGRGLWAMGSDFVYERGAMALYNCAYTDLRSGLDFADDIGWLMDSLMHGVGVGFGPLRTNLVLKAPAPGTYDYRIPDTREGWVELVMRVLWAYISGEQLPYPIYDDVRPAGFPIKGFGGVSSGPEPLKELIEELIKQCEKYLNEQLDEVEFKTNCANLVGCCVVAGNVRRSAEIACASVRDKVFLNLKDYKAYPDREPFGWMSNNSAILDSDEDFDMLGEIAKRVISNGEPGIINKRNLRHGRIGKNDKLKPDLAVGFNPCGEIPLEHREVCNLSETLPTMCENIDCWYKACEYAAFYSSTVTLLPTHQNSTNRVVARNRRIGVGIIDYTGWTHENGVYKVTKWLRNGYEIIRETNRWLAAEAGIPESNRVTTVKPGGTTPKLPGKTSGMGNPTFRYTLRRVRVQQGTEFHNTLVNAGIPSEPDVVSKNTDVFEYPIIQGPSKPAEEVSLWEQANTLTLLQREWSDNAVSNTLYFRPKWVLIEHWSTNEEFNLRKEGNPYTNIDEKIEEYIGASTLHRLIREDEKTYIVPDQYKITLKFSKEKKLLQAKIYEYDSRHEENDIEPVLSSVAPLIKSLSLLPHSAKGVYRQMPEEGITKDEYEKRLAIISNIDWSEFRGSDGIDEKYCSGPVCEVP